MSDPDIDRALATQIALTAARHARDYPLTAEEEAVAVADLRRAAAGRADLLGEHAGVALGFGEGRMDSARYQQIARLCAAAGADHRLMDRWNKIARQRALIAAATEGGSAVAG
jgi:hypothetical protein